MRLTQLIVRLIEQPEFRLAGAEETIRQLSTTVEQALRHQEQLAKELQERAAALYTRMRDLLDRPQPAGPPPTTSTLKSLFARKPQPNSPAAELVELLKAYPKCRYQSMVLQGVSGFYVGLRGQLSDQLREVDFCRARLGELAALVGDDGPGPGGEGAALQVPPEAGTYLLPEGCASLAEVVRRVDEAISGEELRGLDHQVQDLIRRQFRALTHVCMTSANLLRSLAPLMRLEGESFLAAKIPIGDVVETYLAQVQVEENPGPEGESGEGDDPLRQAITAAFEETEANLVGPRAAADLCLLALPAGPAGEEFFKAACLALPEAHLAPVTGSPDEIVCYRERPVVSPFALERFATAAREAYNKAVSQEHFTPHSRADILDW
jgi:hypothetical protein